MRASIVILAFLAFFSCKKSRVEDTVYVRDPSFSPTTTKINVLKENTDTMSCLYENNMRQVYVEAAVGQELEWFYQSGSDYISMGSELFQNLSISGVYRLKHRHIEAQHPVDTVVNFSISYCPASVTFPDAFSPNGDGQFDTYAPVFKGVKQYNFQVLNRSAKVLFQSSSEDPAEWDGTFNGNKSESGTYYYKCTGTLLTGFKFEENGSFQLVR